MTDEHFGALDFAFSVVYCKGSFNAKEKQRKIFLRPTQNFHKSACARLDKCHSDSNDQVSECR